MIKLVIIWVVIAVHPTSRAASHAHKMEKIEFATQAECEDIAAELKWAICIASVKEVQE